jgi:hypothetical protein
MRKFLILAVPLAFLLGCEQADSGLLSPDDALLSSQAAERATGDVVGYGGDGRLREFVFNAHGHMETNGRLRDAKGEATLRRLESPYNWWTMNVAAARKIGDDAMCFIGPVVDGNVIQGTWQRVYVVDNGPGPEYPDMVYTQHVTTEGAARTWYEGCALGALNLQLESHEGNLTVH